MESMMSMRLREPQSGTQSDQPAAQVSKDTTDMASAVDSAYVSTTSSNKLASVVDNDRRAMPQGGKSIEGTDLFVFKKTVDKEALRRYKNVRFAIEDFIREEILATQHDRSCNMAIALRVIGTTEQEAILHLVIFCAPEVESRIRNLMTTPVITALLNHSRPNVPALPYIIVPHPPRTTSAYLDIDVCCNNTFAKEGRTFCGAPILLRTNVNGTYKIKRRQATFGGLINVSYAGGVTKTYGMTAGHFLKDLQLSRMSDTASSSKDLSEESSPYGIDGWICEHNIVGQILDPGRLRGVSAGNATPSHDWALFDVKAPLPNLVVPKSTEGTEDNQGCGALRPILQADRPKFKDDLSDPVLLLSGSHGAQRGELSNLPARIWIAQSRTFVDAYTLELEEGNVSDGDSGAWVVHSAAPELYGHTVATDAFGDAYVIPILNTFENIRTCLGATSVLLFQEKMVSDKDDLHSFSKARIETTKISFKHWHPIFSLKRRSVDNECFVKSVEASNGYRNELEVFLTDSEGTVVAEQIKRFCEKTFVDGELPDEAFSSKSQAKASLHDISCDGSPRMYPRRLTADQLYLSLSQKRFNMRDVPDADRRLIYIADMDPPYILALVRTAPPHQVSSLRDAIWKYLSFHTSLRVRLTLSKSPSFQIEFHIPHFIFRKCQSPTKRKTSDRASKRQRYCKDLPVIKIGAYNEKWPFYKVQEVQFSFTIIGTENSRWTAFCFADTPLNDDRNSNEDSDDTEHDGGFEDEGAGIEDSSDDFNEGPFFSCGKYVENSASGPVWSPRLYFLRIMEIRTEQVVKEWTNLVRHVQQYTEQMCETQSTHSDPEEILEFNLWNTRSIEFCKELRVRLSKTINVWRRFSSPEGDICYFFSDDDVSSKDSTATSDALLRIKELFDVLENLEIDLKYLEKPLHSTLDHARFLQLRSIEDSNRAAHSLLSQANTTYQEIRDTNVAIHGIALSHHEATRRNGSAAEVMILFVVPLAATSALFSIPPSIIPFEGSRKSFIISLFLLTLVLQLLLVLWRGDAIVLGKKIRAGFKSQVF